jgi:uncharacterized membrane protein
MLPLILGIVVFFAVHLVPTSPGLRNGLAERFGEGPYKAAFSLISLAGFALIVAGYHKLQLMPGKNPVLWTPPELMRHFAALLMLPSMILLAAAYIPSRIRTGARHPMLAAVKLWALAHLLVNGDLGAVLLFGSFLAYAIYDRISVKERAAAGPLGARTGGLAGDLAAIGIGIALYLFMLLMGHGLLIGVPILNPSFAP